MTVRIGINPNTWALDDIAELRYFSTPEECLSQASACGYAGMEMGGLFSRDAGELRPQFARHDLALISAWHDGRLLDFGVEEEFARTLPHLEMLKQMGCSSIIYADCSSESFSNTLSPMSHRPRLFHDDWPAYGATLTALADRMAEFGIGMAYHPHIGTIIESDGDVDCLMAHTGRSVGLLLDTGHSILAGGDPVALTARHAERVVHFHGKDARADVLRRALQEDWSFLHAVMEGVFTVPGDGSIDFDTILRHLARAGYAGWLVVEAEQDLRIADPLTYAEMGFGNLVRLAVRAGFSLHLTETVG